MSRNCFEELLSVLHLSDNKKLDKSDSRVQFRPFYDLIVRRCLEFRPNSKNISVNESMLPYYGTNNSKQRIQNRPKR